MKRVVRIHSITTAIYVTCSSWLKNPESMLTETGFRQQQQWWIPSASNIDGVCSCQFNIQATEILSWSKGSVIIQLFHPSIFLPAAQVNVTIDSETSWSLIPSDSGPGSTSVSLCCCNAPRSTSSSNHYLNQLWWAIARTATALKHPLFPQ